MIYPRPRPKTATKTPSPTLLQATSKFKVNLGQIASNLVKLFHFRKFWAYNRFLNFFLLYWKSSTCASYFSSSSSSFSPLVRCIRYVRWWWVNVLQSERNILSIYLSMRSNRCPLKPKSAYSQGRKTWHFWWTLTQ